MAAWPLAMLVGLLPALGIGLGLYFSHAEGHVVACNPWLEGCTTISRCGRYGTAFFVYKIFLAPSAALLAVFWWLAVASLQRREVSVALRRVILLAGLLSAIFLAIYVAYLGSEGGAYALYRRVGASVFFAGGFLAQLLFVVAIGDGAMHAAGTLRLIRVAVLAQLLLGLLSLPITVWVGPGGKDFWENLIEWWFAAAMLSFFPAIAWQWYRDRLGLHLGPMLR